MEVTSDDEEFKMVTRLRAQMLYTLKEDGESSEWSQGILIMAF